ncbi:Short-chain dehydrogenase reductase [Hyphodiscus hymeniophilus]|uniref:Short-chain dehydrogenase reductase n=1 Tax=Hyphodiscus hymeniophilus TaxID=353542 RepID=A0A9P7AU90_9HELO|nr:Short-chain dehydrogenase reductase [Hyphodiscus hymeniophilus]
MPSLFSAIFPPPPTFTEKDLQSLAGKVFIVTGAASGVGFELAKILYGAGGTVYIAARSTSRCEGAIQKIKNQAGNSKPVGRLESIVVDLADLASVKDAANEFLRRETRLDVLVHNAGVMMPPAGSKGKQGHGLEMATNCLAPYLLTILLEPLLIRTAASSPTLSVRVVFIVSLIQFGTPQGGVMFDSQGNPQTLSSKSDTYMQSKAGGALLAGEFAKRLESRNILSVRDLPGIASSIMKRVFKEPVYGAYTELYASLSPELKAEHNGGYIMAWGRIAQLPAHVAKGLKSTSQGGTGSAEKFFEHCDRETKGYK